jgi:RES domain-containing protein
MSASAVPLECGTTLLLSLRAPGLIVPSALVPEARSIVLNPLHPRFAKIGFELVQPFVT